MTVGAVLDAAEKLRPNYLSEKEALRLITRLESILTEGRVSGGLLDINATLSVEDEFCDIYILYLKAEAEGKMEEYERCNNSLAQFSAIFSDYLRLKRRTSGYKKTAYKFFQNGG